MLQRAIMVQAQPSTNTKKSETQCRIRAHPLTCILGKPLLPSAGRGAVARSVVPTAHPLYRTDMHTSDVGQKALGPPGYIPLYSLPRPMSLPLLSPSCAITTLLLTVSFGAQAQNATAIEQRWAHPPAGFTVSVLQPYGGRMLVPVGWKMSSYHDASTWYWNIVPGDTPAKGEPDAMMSVQLEPGMGKDGREKPSAWIERSFAQVKASAVRVFKECNPAPAGLFVRYCLEVEQRSPEGRMYHTSYSAFAADDMAGILGLTIQRSLTSKWSAMEPMFNRMLVVELIDMDGLAADAANEKEAQKRQ